MARSVSVDLDVSRRLKDLSEQTLLAAPLRAFLNEVTREFLVVARGRAPRFRGDLQRAHQRYVSRAKVPLWGEARVESETAIFVHNGTRPHWAPVAALREWAEGHGMNPYALQRSIAKKGTRAQPWFSEAEDRYADDIMAKHLPALDADITARWGR